MTQEWALLHFYFLFVDTLELSTELAEFVPRILLSLQISQTRVDVRHNLNLHKYKQLLCPPSLVWTSPLNQSAE